MRSEIFEIPQPRNELKNKQTKKGLIKFRSEMKFSGVQLSASGSHFVMYRIAIKMKYTAKNGNLLKFSGTSLLN